jgi:ferredoxin
MATVITSECINCGACEPECPNTAIYQGGVEWEMNGTMRAPISNDIFYIVPEKCTECVGFFDHEACAAVCPVDCCVPDPNIPETEEQLIARAKVLHPEVTFDADFPSRFKKEAGDGAEAPAAAAETPAAPVQVVAPLLKVAARAPGARVERAVRPPAKPYTPKKFAGELTDDFDSLLQRVVPGSPRKASLPVRVLVALLLPIIGALPHETKRKLEAAAAGRTPMSALAATCLNVLLNFFLYPIVLAAVGAIVFHRDPFSLTLESFIFYGVALASIETAWRLREGLFYGVPSDEMRLGAALYGLLMMPLAAPFTRLAGARSSGTIAFDGFYDDQFDEKRDRQRRYGEVYNVREIGSGYLLQLEFPQRVPPTSLKEQLMLPDEMPDYDFDLAMSNGSLVVRGRVADPLIRKVAAGAPSFPPDFTTRIEVGQPVRGFKHRYRDKTLEVILVKHA